MAISPEQSKQDSADFDAAYNEDMPTPAQKTDDDAFGLVPDEAVMADDGIPNSPEEAQEVTEPTANESNGGHPPGLTLEEQRAKSWEGRKQAQAREAAAGTDDGGEVQPSEEASETPAEEAEEPEVSELLEDAAEKTEGMSPDEALKTLAADFGDDFAKLLSTIIDAKVAKASDTVSKSVNEIIEDIVDTKARNHFETIADRHPDFMDIANSEDFKAYCADKPECAAIVDTGTARQINKMLDDFKKTKEPAQDDSSMDDAEGVRSSGMRLPAQPAASSDYSAAWDEA